MTSGYDYNPGTGQWTVDPTRYYLKGNTRVIVADPKTAHGAATYYELSYRERIALAGGR